MAGRSKRRAGAVAQIAVSRRGYDEIATAQDYLIGELPHAGLAMPRCNQQHAKNEDGSTKRRSGESWLPYQSNRECENYEIHKNNHIRAPFRISRICQYSVARCGYARATEIA